MKKIFLIMSFLSLGACTSGESSQQALNWDNMNFAKIICLDDGDVPNNCPNYGKSSYKTAIRANLSTP